MRWVLYLFYFLTLSNHNFTPHWAELFYYFSQWRSISPSITSSVTYLIAVKVFGNNKLYIYFAFLISQLVSKHPFGLFLFSDYSTFLQKEVEKISIRSIFYFWNIYLKISYWEIIFSRSQTIATKRWPEVYIKNFLSKTGQLLEYFSQGYWISLLIFLNVRYGTTDVG